MIITKIKPMSLAKIQTVLMGIFGLFMAVVYGILMLMVTSLNPEVSSQIQILGPWEIVLMPFMYAAIGFVIGLVGAFVYNLIAKWVGGIEIELMHK